MHNFEPNESSDLISRLKSGEVAAYEKIYFNCAKELLAMAYRKTGDKIVAEELVQNIFISLWEKRLVLDIQDLKAYLFGALKLSIINHIRSEVMANKYIAYQQMRPVENYEDGASRMDVQDLSGLIEKGLNSLPEKTQEVFRLSRYNHQSTKEISTELNISEKAVEYHITRSLKRIREYVKNFYVFFLL